MRTLSFALVLGAIWLLSACGKDSQEEIFTERISGTSFVGKPWSLTGIDIELGTVIPLSCIGDNNFTYFQNGRYEVNEGVTKCEATDPPGLVGSWFFNENETQITVQIEDSIRVWDIIDITSSVHRLSSNFDGDIRTYTFEAIN